MSVIDEKVVNSDLGLLQPQTPELYQYLKDVGAVERESPFDNDVGRYRGPLIFGDDTSSVVDRAKLTDEGWKKAFTRYYKQTNPTSQDMEDWFNYSERFSPSMSYDEQPDNAGIRIPSIGTAAYYGLTDPEDWKKLTYKQKKHIYKMAQWSRAKDEWDTFVTPIFDDGSIG